MDKRRRSKDMLRKKEQRIIEEMRKMDSEITKDNISEDNGEEMPWLDSDGKEEKQEALRTELEEIQRELGVDNLVLSNT